MRKQYLFMAALLVMSGILGCAAPPGITRVCPDTPKTHIVEIRQVTPETNDYWLGVLSSEIQKANTIILLGPEVVLDFSKFKTANPDDDALLHVGPCVALVSVSSFSLEPPKPNVANPVATTPPFALITPPNNGGGIRAPASARTSHSLGPLFKFGPHRSEGNKAFLSIDCSADPNKQPSDNVVISGFRLYGPSFGQQSDKDVGIRILRCLNIEISNMEVAGWGNAGIEVLDEGIASQQPPDGPGQQEPNNLPGDRIGQPVQIRIFNNYIHHNQHPREGLLEASALGYGVVVSHGAWAQIYQNVFDFNRHAIAASCDSGGYEALRNLVLEGGGIHWDTGITIHTHIFDVHGTGDDGKCGSDADKGGPAGVRFLFANNAFQYHQDNAIYIRGTPRQRVDINANVFAHEDLQDDAIKVQYDADLNKVIFIGSDNVTNFDSFGNYGVCDFDGDGIDDLFLATGETWWFSGSGEFPWTYLSAHTERLAQVRLGYFDNDKSCDVLTESGAEWLISSGGTGMWQSLGAFGAPLRDVTFGQFDPSVRDHRPGVTRQATQAFWRTESGEWRVTTLAGGPAWQPVQSSSFPMSKLRFGDFTGDGVTDVLAVEGGHWAISDAARTSWRQLNAHLSDDVSRLYIADLDNNNIDDLIKLDVSVLTTVGDLKSVTYSWWVSTDGRSSWRHLKEYTFLLSAPPKFSYAFAGRFGSAPGGGLLFISYYDRTGLFFSEAESAVGAPPEWISQFPY